MIFFNQVYAHFFTAFGHCEPSKVGWCFGLINFSLALAFFFALWTDVLSCSLKCVCQIGRLISNVRRQVCRMISKKKKKNAGKSIVRWNQSTFLCVAMFCLFIFGQPLNRWLDWTYCDSLLQCCSHYSYRIQKKFSCRQWPWLVPPVFFLCHAVWSRTSFVALSTSASSVCMTWWRKIPRRAPTKSKYAFLSVWWIDKNKNKNYIHTLKRQANVHYFPPTINSNY